MDCEKFDRILLDVLYGELDELTQAAAHRHLEHCQRCRSTFHRLQSVRDVVPFTLVPGPTGFEQRVLEAERSERHLLPLGQRLVRAWTITTGYAMRPQLAMAALLMLMIGSSLLFLKPRPGSKTQDIQVTEKGRPNDDEVVIPIAAKAEEADGVTVETSEASEPPITASPVTAPSATTTTTNSAPPAVALAKRASLAAQPREVGPQMVLLTPEGLPQDESAAEAEEKAFAEATLVQKSGDQERALTLFEAIVATGGNKAQAADLQAALLTEALRGCQEALSRFDSVAARNPTNSLGHTATWHSASCRVNLGQLRRAMHDFEKLTKVPQYQTGAKHALAGIANVLNRPAHIQEKALQK
jgi:hypothetical protein